ncbi:hypothetical protein GCM10010264_52400 [Streptomyces globisporus]|nr:hypothetical protein GCM10010264_52400 [Streptomyces globisporus]
MEGDSDTSVTEPVVGALQYGDPLGPAARHGESRRTPRYAAADHGDTASTHDWHSTHSAFRAFRA